MNCIWKLDIWHDYFETDCGHAFCFSDDEGLKDKAFKFCPYCGNEIIAQMKEE